MTLSPTQQTVIRLLALGKSPRAISKELGITQSTVAVHKFNACRKMGWKNLIDIHHGAMAAGWITAEDLTP